MLWKKAQRWAQQRAAGDEWHDLGFVFTTSKGTPLHRPCCPGPASMSWSAGSYTRHRRTALRLPQEMECFFGAHRAGVEGGDKAAN